MTERALGDVFAHPRILLLGDPTLRPDGLERALVRAGFQVLEADLVPDDPPAGTLPDLVLLTVPDAGPVLTAELARLGAGAWAEVPVFALLAAEHPDGALSALRLGAAEAMSAPVHLAELCVRVEARLRGRASLDAHRRERRVNGLMFDIFAEVSTAIRPDEILQTLVRRVGAALDLAHCSFLLTPPGEATGRVVAVYESAGIRDLTVDLARYPEVQEAVRTERPVYVADVHSHPLFTEARAQWAEQQLRVQVRSVLAIPVALQGRISGVFLLRTRRSDPALTPEQVAFAETITTAAARVLETEERRSTMYRRLAGVPAHDPLTGCGTLDALDRRIREEFERARRYALSFSLILLDVDQLRNLNERLGTEGGDRVLAELGRLLQRELRAPDFVSRYGGDEFALILPETDLAGARRSVTRVRERILAAPFADLAAEDRPRLSAGIVTFPHPSAVQTEDLFALVEAALLRGKAQTDERIGTADSVAA
ncbi:MAG TPA: diguanylate cyclase [Gemmatimonadales bacterium]|nr:diguanylate cyclase [Gemmatimonadales bacterium]